VTKNVKKFTAENFLFNIFVLKNYNLSFPRPPEGFPSHRRSLTHKRERPSPTSVPDP
jgi:hypothetical protein